MKLFYKSLLALFFFGTITAQNNTTYWQQKVDYKMNIDVDADKGQYKGTQQLTYTNNSPDALNRVFYHLYFNAFQPGSEMDVRSQTIADPDPAAANCNCSPPAIALPQVPGATADESVRTTVCVRLGDNIPDFLSTFGFSVADFVVEESTTYLYEL